MIFNIFKSGPTLKELIPSGFVDIHSHILPGIDDGAKNIEESLILIDKIERLGCKKIITTPHIYPGLYDNTEIEIKKKYFSFKEFTNSNINIDIACEYMVDISLIEKCDKKELLTLSNNYILLETSFSTLPNYFYEVVYHLSVNNYKIILAHPERYLYLFKNKREIYKLKKTGLKFQLNALSLTGYYGKESMKLCDTMLGEELFDFIGTDIHNIKHIEEINSSKVRINRGNLKKLNKLFENNLSIFGD